MASNFEASSTEIFARGQCFIYHLHLQKMYSKIIPAKCRVKVGREGRHMRVILGKVSDQEWKYLKV